MKVVTKHNGIFPWLLSDFFTENSLDVSNYENFSNPPVNISENLTNFVIDMAIPGFNKENFVIEIEKEVLKVSSNFAPAQDATDTDNKLQFTRKEFDYNSFSRSFTLPETVSTDSVNASYINGILSITIPKKEEVKDVKKMVEIS